MTEAAGVSRRPGLALALVLALSGLALGATAALPGCWDVLEALVPALVFWGGLSVGSLALLLVHRLTGGQWGEDLRPALLAAAGVLPLVALLATPLLLGLDHLYPWAAAGGAGDAPARWYLNPAAFRARTLAILVLWLFLAWSLGAYAPRTRALPSVGASAFYLLLLVLSSTLIGFDWVMSLDPAWYSAVFGLLVGVSQTLAAMALAALWLGLAGRRSGRGSDGPLQGGAGTAPTRSPDTGNLLLTILLLWCYLVLMQFVTIWIANLPHEIRWFVPRLQTDWRWLGLAVMVLLPGLALPLLLSRRVKTRPGGLALAAGVVLAGQALYALWLTLPTLHPAGPRAAPLELAVPAAAGALWLAAFVVHRTLTRPAAATSGGWARAALPDPGGRRMPPAVRTLDAAPAPIAEPRRATGMALSRTGGHTLVAGDGPGGAPPVRAAGTGGPGVRKQEPGGIAAGPIVKSMAGVVLVLIAWVILLLPWRHEQTPEARPPAAGPALLANPVANLAAYRAEQLEQARQWRWVDRRDGIAQIPVERAIEILLARKAAPASSTEAQP